VVLLAELWTLSMRDIWEVGVTGMGVVVAAVLDVCGVE